MRIEALFIILSICAMAIYLYKQKELHFIHIRQRVQKRRSRRYIEVSKDEDGRMMSRLKFMTAVIMNKELAYFSSKLLIITGVAVFMNAVLLVIIINTKTNILLRSVILILVNILVYRLIFDFCIIKYKRDSHRYITILQNETLQKNDILSCAKEAAGKSLPCLVTGEVMIYINELVKNSASALSERYLRYTDTTFGYEMSLICVFLSNSSVSGNSEVIRRNLKALEKYFSKGYERYKDKLFSKLPYMAIMLLLPLFMYWMDSFGAAMAAEGIPKSDPKEYIYIISLTLSYLYSFV